jgi:hypothetical protein
LSNGSYHLTNEEKVEYAGEEGGGEDKEDK